MGNLKKSHADSKQKMKRLRGSVLWIKKRRRSNINRRCNKARRVDVLIFGDTIYERIFKVPCVFWTVTEASCYDPYPFARSGSAALVSWLFVSQ
jgi:hypothetical protein